MDFYWPILITIVAAKWLTETEITDTGIERTRDFPSFPDFWETSCKPSKVIERAEDTENLVTVFDASKSL